MGDTEREEKRVERWHATYNAALAGLLSGKNETYQDSANIAEQLANARHGALDPEPTIADPEQTANLLRQHFVATIPGTLEQTTRHGEEVVKAIRRMQEPTDG